MENSKVHLYVISRKTLTTQDGLDSLKYVNFNISPWLDYRSNNNFVTNYTHCTHMNGFLGVEDLEHIDEVVEAGQGVGTGDGLAEEGKEDVLVDSAGRPGQHGAYVLLLGKQLGP